MGDHISYSEIRTFERCKRLHWYTYERGWEPVREDDKLADGRWMHKLLAAYYTEKFVAEQHDAILQAALESCLFDEERDVLRARADLIAGVLDNYIAHYEAERWEPVYFEDEPLVEREILVPLPSGGTLKILVDLVARDRESGLIWVWDHKTKKEFDKDMEARLDFDPQLSIYTVGLRALGINVVGGLHNYIRMRLPRDPQINKDGSMSKVQVITDEASVRAFVAHSGVKISEPDLEAYIAKLPKDAFFRRYTTLREEHELSATVQELEMKLREREMARREGMNTRTLIRDCIFCPFFSPCLTSMKGGDEEVVLAERFRRRETEPVQAPLPADFEGGES